jgi:subtilisin family serine protease
MAGDETVSGTGMLLAKLRATPRLGAAGRTDLEPLRTEVQGARRKGFAFDGSPQWFRVQTEPDASPWDQAHARVAGQLGIDESDVLFVEPDLVQTLYPDDTAADVSGGLGVGGECDPITQDGNHNKAVGQGFAWHLGANFSQLGPASGDVTFTEPRTTIAHIDTGWSKHETKPVFVDEQRQRNFVDADRRNARDPDNWVFLLDNSGHGTGTISILAGGKVSAHNNKVLGGAPDARVVPLRIADRVVLWQTSALAQAIMYASDIGCEVATLSMGGVPSRAWADAIDDAYDYGLCLVAAAGNRVLGTPRAMVWPARYERVVAVAGVMANNTPYEGLTGAMEGCFGPDSVTAHALAAFTPNIPWAEYGCPQLCRESGEGTSAATPQVAAAAALWIEKYKGVLPDNWRRVAAVRNALFTSAKQADAKFGHGILQAEKALGIAPNLRLTKSAESTHSWPVFRMLTGLGIQAGSVREEMFNLELAQLWLTNSELHEILPDPAAAAPLPPERYQQVLDAVLEDPHASKALKEHLRERYRYVAGEEPPAGPPPAKGIVGPAKASPVHTYSEPPIPPNRRVRVFAKDPTLASAFATSSVSQVTLQVPWEPVTATEQGFHGEYLEVVDDEIEPAKGKSPGLDHPNLLAQDGWAPAPGNLQFHQQMVYGVASKTIEHFEIALGRPVLWAPQRLPDSRSDGRYVPRLTVRPHALATANAYYEPSQSALLFGSFTPDRPGSHVPGFPVYTCLSYDIIAHETTHAILDGMYRRFTEPSNVDVLAFHEAFADIVALLQGFDLTELLEHEISSSRGNLRAETILGKLAIELGNAARGREALRSAIGQSVNGVWVPSRPDATLLAQVESPHERGAILVAAVFDALIAIYESRTSDLFRLATGGTGRLPDGAIHPDLTKRLASEASKVARQVLQMCIRTLDYLPPVDVTFFDFLRALITADAEYVPDDKYKYRIAVVEAFTKRGIAPGNSDADAGGPVSLDADAMRWPSFAVDLSSGAAKHYEKIEKILRDYAEECVYIRDRKRLFNRTRGYRVALNHEFAAASKASTDFRDEFGLAEGSIEVHTLRKAMRARPNGRIDPELIVSLTQTRRGLIGGATLVVNLTESTRPRYRIVKRIDDQERQDATARFRAANEADPLRKLLVAPESNQFALLHQLVDRPR